MSGFLGPFANFLRKIDYNDIIVIRLEILEHDYEECSSLNSIFDGFLFQKNCLTRCRFENLKLYNSTVSKSSFYNTIFQHKIS